MEKRAILCAVLCLGVLLLWNIFVINPRMEKMELKRQATLELEQEANLASPDSNNTQLSETISNTTERDKIIAEAVVSPVKLSPVGGDKEVKDIHVDTALTSIILTNKGGLIKSFKLKKHLDSQKKPLELVVPDSKILPLYIDFDNAGTSNLINNDIIYTPSSESLIIDESNNKGQISFIYKDASGFTVSKFLTFYNDKYQIDVRTIIDNADFISSSSTYRIFWGSGLPLGRIEKAAEKERKQFYKVTSFVNNEVENELVKNVVNNELTYKGQIGWTALQNKYFAVVLVPESSDVAVPVVKKGANPDDMSVGLQYRVSGSSLDNNIMLFVGPKNLDRIMSYNIKMERLINFGFFGNIKFLINPIFQTLQFLYRYSHNYGIAIIILTILMKILFLPLSQKSLKSTERMKHFQPQIKILQERYKDDKTKLNEETMRFYKENKINPLGGCLPMLFQLPLFFALYNILLYSVELRHAPFFFWIHDLSAKDPLYILPILMGVSMFMMQRMTPSTGDATQAKMMMLMPVVMTFMFLNFPVGLVIYWLLNNILQIMQQLVIRKTSTA